ncbi:hypothetical protein [Kitasatospora purpeofusca]|uniref:hypothetical protein n=1 Tax=Kitasatospora purpeofusca TaxID=67352 RepID=UPI002250C268|nr:hypothetical protein [Kitasatospora purpeofusca]MCX4752423.1 hypothetical protein [Kitasatospora purpeofusca]WSR31996.1 hypothetical protein OG715_14000 [Kitasatospora purpeofusca]
MTLIPILSYGLVFDDRPIVTASRELAESYTDPDLTMAEHLAEAFVSEGRWCRVGADIHTLGHGDFELRLQPSAGGWHADLFPGSWARWSEFGDVPAEYRHPVAVYADTRERLSSTLPDVEALKLEHLLAGDDGVAAVVAQHVALLDDRLRALDALQACLPSEARRWAWAAELLTDECREVKEQQDVLSAVFMEFHLGRAGILATTVLFVPGFDLPSGFVPLTRAHRCPEADRPAAEAMGPSPIEERS